ncbi:thioredoxin domain-containing protein [Edaphobacter sp. 12200R-103]|uniref:thioredoxin domain-containing protein n=1 Tax=Edaphobacter sp. 12200R-103 TaxID=2703788 RepID=UPI00138CEDE1|nr:thioredoxin domain-containing protein [Edaphobacter sp. 12200R-103]QHS51134.1 thioredoxin domain-containing protein [Edaphobacter sp. 12200R-103]
MSESNNTATENALKNSSSAYLRSAMHQPVQWHEWGDEAFARAQEEDKPILLDIGAVWCHWCHVMDRESYEHPAIAELINKHFIAIKVDRDERPDVDTRYQAAVSAISGQGGWPLTGFLTPDGRPFFGGTYFPPEDRHGRPGFPRVLMTMIEAFQQKRDDVNDSAAGVMAAIEHNESFMGKAGNPGPELVAKLVDAGLKQFDPRSGGFGSQPKFPHSGAIDLLLDAASRVSPATSPEQSERARTAALVTLQKMSRGGIYDHLAGGFHRYSVDEHWIVPHFEKMAYDNSELLKNYVHAYQTFVEPECARVARDIIRWMDEWLTDREQGGFYSSQDADFSLDDDGDYFTWTREEASAVLTPEELTIAADFYDIGEIGDMHHNPQKNVLHVRDSLDQLAVKHGIALERASALLLSAKEKLYAARLKRPTPYIDKTMYVGWNAMCISAYLVAGRVLHLPETSEFALKSLDRVLKATWNPEHGLAHVLVYGEGVPGKRVPGTLEDYAALANAALDAWEATGEHRYYEAAQGIADTLIARFYDMVGGAFFDTESTSGNKIGALSVRRKPLQDSPTPAGNSVAAMLLVRLEALNQRDDYAAKALETVETFAGIVEHFGLYAASYGLALQRMVKGPVQVCIIGEDGPATELETAALARYAVNKSVIRLRRTQLQSLPPSLAETIPHLPGIKDASANALAVVCTGRGCLPPVHTTEELMEQLNQTL